MSRFDWRWIYFAVFLSVLAGKDAPAEPWSRFRGPNGSGIAPAGDYPAELNDRTLVWKRPLAGGKSSPVLTSSRIFITSAESGKLTVHCLDRRTGETVWERSVPEQRREFQHSLNTSASSTPVTDGENVYAFFGNFGLISFSGTGRECWRVPLGPFSSVWGMASSPVLAGGNVVLLLDGFGTSYIAAFNQRTGKQAWKSARQPFAMNYSTPVVRRSSTGADEILAPGPRQLTAYDAQSGAVHWTSAIPSGVIVASPGLSQDLLYLLTYSLESVPSFDEELKVRDSNRDEKISADEFPGGEHGRVLHSFGSMYGNRDNVIERSEWVAVWNEWVGKSAITAVRLNGPGNAETGSAIAWKYERNVPRVPTPLLLDNTLYAVSSGGILVTLDAKTGIAAKVGRLTGALDNYFSSPVAAGELVFLISESGKVTVLRSGRPWTLEALSDLGDECFATPALSGGRIFIRTAAFLWCFATLASSKVQ